MSNGNLSQSVTEKRNESNEDRSQAYEPCVLDDIARVRELDRKLEAEADLKQRLEALRREVVTIVGNMSTETSESMQQTAQNPTLNLHEQLNLAFRRVALLKAETGRLERQLRLLSGDGKG
ncbi:hypothetical protein E4U13_000305 [Claviceps humidiphila]|uniref:Uncharacterized protein n=1 Tax=Claviceps humidiphila TaxID=1294629 RepID=A0A9P7Q4D7_9HYPO|nr:hypothetical protein E4U13_000305 [Claviceps humidiphila]